MASSTVKSVTISLPAEMVEELDRVRKREHRSLSDLIREALQQYVASTPGRRIPIVDPEPGELDSLAYGRQQAERGEYVLLEDLLDDLDADGHTPRREKPQKIPE
jgi:predicted transcriptional regulator